MKAVDQWQAIEAGLASEWAAVRLAFTPEEAKAIASAAGTLAPLTPGRAGASLTLRVSRQGSDPARLVNLLGHLDRKRIWGTLELLEAAVEAQAEPSGPPTSGAVGLADAWDAALATLPAGWRDLLCELALDSSTLLPRAALLGAPLNPTRNPDAVALRFRASSGGGYGTATQMVRRCFERMDAEGITGRVVILNVLSDTGNVATQGAVWRIAGRSV
ncbi:MAG: hypothetical protein R6W48_08340 [Gaiellaceae bacterium]